MKLNNAKINSKLLSWALLLLRVCFGTLMIVNHGWVKIVTYETLKIDFYNFLGIGSHPSLILTIMAEVLCAILLLFGLYTRLALIPLIVTMAVASYIHGWEVFGKAELAFIYLIVFVFLFITGPGSKSIDARMEKKSYY